MSGATTSPADERSGFAGPGGRRSRRGWTIVAVALVLVAAGVVALVSGELHGSERSRGSGNSDSATSLATVARRTLSRTTQFNGTLGYADSYTVLGLASGRVTWLPSAGRVIHQGQVLYRADEAPVVLLYGAVPAYRTLAEGVTAGRDVGQLNHDLVALGDVSRSAVNGDWDEFSWATAVGVERLQQHLGVDQTGSLVLGEVAFLPTAARVTSLLASLGAPAAGPVLRASSTARTVRVPLDPDLQSTVRVGNRVTITLPDGRTTPGSVTSVGKVASGSGGSDSGPTVPVYIQPADPRATGSVDQALVEVAITDQTVHNVLAVPVNALLALSGGGYAVEVVAGDGIHRLVRVRPGLFDDAAGMVQVSGPGLAAGQRVVVPGQ